VKPSAQNDDHDRPPNAAGLAALVTCLRRYVETYPSRFEVIEGTKRNSITRTFVFGRGLVN